MQKILARAASINSVEQRLALGVTAMAIQPVIDLKNKKIAPETRITSANRSFAKAFVGLATGLVVRSGCIKAAEAALTKEALADKLAKITAQSQTKKSIEKAKDFIKNKGGAKQYAAVIGTLAALGIMIGTNFLLDAPLTNLMTNKLNKKYDKNAHKEKPAAQTNSFEGLSPINKSWAENVYSQRNTSDNKGGVK